MWPDQPYAGPRGSFLRPVPVPAVEPGASPNRAVVINCSWLPYVRGALMQLLLQATWQTDDPDTLLLAQQRVFNLINLFDECAGGPGIACPFDFTQGAAADGGFTLIDFGGDQSPSTNGAFLDNIGWASTNSTQTSDGSIFNDVSIEKTLASPITIDDIFIEYNLLHGDFDRDVAVNRLLLYNGSTVVGNDHVQSISEGTGIHSRSLSSGPYTIDKIRIDICAGFDHADPGGSAVLQYMQYHVTSGSCGGE